MFNLFKKKELKEVDAYFKSLNPVTATFMYREKPSEEALKRSQITTRGNYGYVCSFLRKDHEDFVQELLRKCKY